MRERKYGQREKERAREEIEKSSAERYDQKTAIDGKK